MLSESVPNASVAAPSSNRKDVVKKKRANRLSKLKQCKLDARREQWLSQVRNKIGSKEGTHREAAIQEPLVVDNEIGQPFAELEIIPNSLEKDAPLMTNQSDSESMASNSPTSCGSSVFGNNYGSTSSSTSTEIDPVILAAQYITGAASNSSSSGRSSSCSSSIFCIENASENDEGDADDDDCVDDWEARADADALAASVNQPPDCNPDKEICTAPKHDVAEKIVRHEDGINKPFSDRNNPITNHSKGKTVDHKCLEKRHAWKPHDAFRPRSLPSLSKQYSSITVSERHRGRQSFWDAKKVLPVTTSCPICYEDFDCTDSSFLPCPCGFRICLFCHKRIIEEDGRCPVCRKPYDLKHVDGEATLNAGFLTL